jgi:hypothetical protein
MDRSIKLEEVELERADSDSDPVDQRSGSSDHSKDARSDESFQEEPVEEEPEFSYDSAMYQKFSSNYKFSLNDIAELKKATTESS